MSPQDQTDLCLGYVYRHTYRAGERDTDLDSWSGESVGPMGDPSNSNLGTSVLATFTVILANLETYVH